MLTEITQILSVFSAWAISISAIMGALSAVCKPLRTLIATLYKKLFGATSSDKILEEIKGMRTELNAVSEKCDKVSDKNDANERDRLKDVLFRYGNYARQGVVITGEEFRYIQKVFIKYTDLGGNDIAHDEYKFIEDYYNHRRWEERRG